MKRLISALSEHPASVGETYTQHLVSASRFSLRMIGAGICCFVHGLLPFLFVKTGSDTVTRLHDRMVMHRERKLPNPSAGPARNADVLNAG
jgi:hypothetical protein